MKKIRINYFRIVDIPDLFKQVEWKKCCKAIDASGRKLLRKERVVGGQVGGQARVVGQIRGGGGSGGVGGSGGGMVGVRLR